MNTHKNPEAWDNMYLMLEAVCFFLVLTLVCGYFWYCRLLKKNAARQAQIPGRRPSTEECDYVELDFSAVNVARTLHI